MSKPCIRTNLFDFSYPDHTGNESCPICNPPVTVHYHHCPTCYEAHECTMNCTICPDLEDNGKQFGSHCECEDCQKEIKDKEFWDIYHGFKKKK